MIRLAAREPPRRALFSAAPPRPQNAPTLGCGRGDPDATRMTPFTRRGVAALNDGTPRHAARATIFMACHYATPAHGTRFASLAGPPVTRRVRAEGSRSGGDEGHCKRFSSDLPVLNLLSEHAKGQCFGACHGLFPGVPIGHHAGQSRQLRNPSPVTLALDFDGVLATHGLSVRRCAYVCKGTSNDLPCAASIQPPEPRALARARSQTSSNRIRLVR